jgi:hypothetical protein
MPRTTRTHGTKKNDDSGRARSNDGMKMRGARANDEDRATRHGKSANGDATPRKSNGRFTGGKRGQ